MSGFQFGQSGTATSGSLFSGLNKTPTTTAGGFGTLNFSTPIASASPFGSLSNSQTPTSGLSFPTAQQSTSGSLFSTPISLPSGTMLGTSLSQTPGSSINFSTPTTQGTGISFGTPTLQPQLGGTLAFNSTSAPSVFTLGQPAFSTASSAFGSTSAPPSFSLGQPASSTAASVGFSFGQTSTPGFMLGQQSSTTAGSSGLTFNSTSNVPSSGFTLGQSASSTAVSSGLAFGGTTTAQPASLFGTAPTTSQPTLSLKLSTTSAPSSFFSAQPTAPTVGSATTSSLGGTASSVSSLSFPTLGTSTSALTFGGTTTSSLGLSTTATLTTTTSGFGSSTIFGQPSFGFSIPSSTSAVSTAALGGTSTIGLGGVDSTQSKTGLAGRQESKTVKETVVNQEIVQTIEKFEEYVKTQKSASSEISQGSMKCFQKVAEDSESLKQLLSRLTSGLQKNLVVASKLKFDTAKCLKNAEMAQRTQVTPSGLQYDNMAPQQYFSEMVYYFEEEMKSLQNEINNIEKYVRSSSQSRVLNPEELSLTMRRLHETFVALAGRIQTLRSSVETQKQQYLDCRKKIYKDNTNIFEDTSVVSGDTNKLLKPKTIGSTDFSGPSPFSASQNGFGLLPLSAADTNAPFTSSSALGWGRVPSQQPFFSLQSQQQPQSQSSVMFSGGSNFGSLSTPQPVENQGFQLQKPPVGNKRGKR